MKKNRCYDGVTPLFYQILRKMKLTLLFFFLALLNSIAANSYSQSMRLTLKVENVRIEDLLNRIEDQSKFRFFYTDEVNLEKRVTIDSSDETIDNLLNKIFLNTGIQYEITDRQIILKNMTYSTEFSIQEKKSVSGKVTDSSGSPLPGVSVVIKGTTNGTTTDADGNYSMVSLPSDVTLIFSFVGMKSQEISIGGKKTINVIMEEETIGIEEVVAVGYGTQKKVNLTGAVSTINADVLESRPVTNVTQAIQGLSTGVEIAQTSYGGSLEGTASINIRGLNTIGEGSTGGPLILIDGAEGNINYLNPNDIESISILKDAAASAIYGSRAPFGVILITTKRGTKGAPVITYSYNSRINNPINFPKTADSYRWALFINDASNNSGSPDFVGPERLQRIKDYIAGKPGVTNLPVDSSNPTRWAPGSVEGNDNLDWWKVVFKDKALSQEHTVGLRGGGDHVNYYISGGFLDQGGLLNLGGDGLKRYNVTANIETKVNNWVTFTYNGKFSREDYDRPSHFEGRFMQYMSRIQPANPLYDPNGYLYDVTTDRLSIIAVGGRYNRIIDHTSNQFGLMAEPINGLKFHGRFFYRLSDRFARTVKLATYGHDVSGNPYMAESENFVSEYIERNDFISQDYYLEYNKTLGMNNLKLMIGMQSEQNLFRKASATRNGLIITENPTINVTTGMNPSGDPITPSVSGAEEEWATAGYFGRLNYDYMGRYLFEANLRYDGTSRFRANRRWGMFPSLSLGWNVAKESFWEPYISAISLMKIRGSYGVLGNQNTSALYPTYATMSIGMNNGGWLLNGDRPNTAYSPGLVSSSLTWEKIKAWNIGTDIAAFQNRLSLTFDYFTRYTNDMVGPAPELPNVLGASVPRTNNTDLKTYGFELELSWNERLANGFRYGVKFLLSDAQTIIQKYPNHTGNIYSYLEGYKTGNIWGYETVGIAKTQEEMDAHLSRLSNGGQDALGSNWSAGDIMFRDLNGDKKIDGGTGTIDNPGDLRIIGNDTPRYQFGLDVNAQWKGFDFRAFFQGVMKREYYNGGYNFWGAGPNVWWATAYIPHLDYFRDDPDHPLGLNLDSYYPRPYFNGDYWSGSRNKATQTRYLQNAAYIRLKNLTLGYTIPSQIATKLKVDRVRFYFSGENLWTHTKISKLFDPEVLDQGYTGSVYPLSKVYAIGINVSL
jgi:TonB-linked SusC/RagA family outer membrane protein